MKVQNRKTGEIANLIIDKDILRVKTGAGWQDYSSLTGLYDEWKDYVPDGCWIINICGIVEYTHFRNETEAEFLKGIGNYFSSREEAEKAVEKLKAWKRMKKCGLRFWDLDTVHLKIGYSFENYSKEDIPQLKKDLDLLFGGEE